MSAMKNKNKALLLSILIIVVGAVMFFVNHGLNMSTDFTGGKILTIELGEDFHSNQIYNAFKQAGAKGITVQKSHDGKVSNTAIIKMKTSGEEEKDIAMQDEAIATIKTTYESATLTEVTTLGAKSAVSIIQNMLLPMLLATVAVFAYIAIRFSARAGISAVISLLHDVLLLLAIASITRIQVNEYFIAVILFTVALSAYHTISLYNMINRQAQTSTTKESIALAVDNGVKESSMRVLFTAFALLLMCTLMYFLATAPVQSYLLPIGIAVITSTYSSFFITGPLWGMIAANNAHKTNTTKKRK